MKPGGGAPLLALLAPGGQWHSLASWCFALASSVASVVRCWWFQLSAGDS